MALTTPLTLEPMEAAPVATLPTGVDWSFEPKYDGFRCLAFRSGAALHLQSRRQRPLERYFPEVAAGLLALPEQRFVLDGELIIPGQPFDTLQLRLHPAASRVARLACEHPARLVAFDLLEWDEALGQYPFVERRQALERFAARAGASPVLEVGQSTRSAAEAQGWLAALGHGLDGLVAKDGRLTYAPGIRAMRKYKLWRTIDCVVGGVYLKGNGPAVEYLLLGLYGADGLLHYVGRCGFEGNGAAMADIVRPYLGGMGFTGRAPGGASRWRNSERTVTTLRPELVAEVTADHVENGRFRHGARLLRWRTDKAPARCGMEQM